MSDYIKKRVEETLKQLTRDRHRAFARALRCAVTVDLSRLPDESEPFTIDPKPVLLPDIYRPDRIQREHGFTVREQEKFGLALTRTEAFEYLDGITAIRKSVFERYITWGRYVKKYKIEPFSLYTNRNVMLLTYAEWIHFLGIQHEPELPDIQSLAGVR